MDQELVSTMPGGGMMPSKNHPSYLTELAEEVNVYQSLLKVLEEKLSVVSESIPKAPGGRPEGEPRIHVSTIVSILRANNQDLDRLIGGLAL